MNDNEFGETLDEMDIEAFFNIRQFVGNALTAAGAEIGGAGIGMGQADIDFQVEGMPFNLSIKPRSINPPAPCHKSDCAVHNGPPGSPVLDPDMCDCGALDHPN